jgi:hypothetical protein
VTRQQETKQQEQRHLSCLLVCAAKVAELWERPTWFVNLVLFLKDDVLSLTQVGLEVFEGCNLLQMKCDVAQAVKDKRILSFKEMLEASGFPDLGGRRAKVGFRFNWRCAGYSHVTGNFEPASSQKGNYAPEQPECARHQSMKCVARVMLTSTRLCGKNG